MKCVDVGEGTGRLVRALRREGMGREERDEVTCNACGCRKSRRSNLNLAQGACETCSLGHCVGVLRGGEPWDEVHTPQQLPNQ